MCAGAFLMSKLLLPGQNLGAGRVEGANTPGFYNGDYGDDMV